MNIPHNVEAEEAVLGAMMLSANFCAEARERITAGDFYAPSHALFFDSIALLHDNGHATDPQTLAAKFPEMSLEQRQRATFLVSSAPNSRPLAQLETVVEHSVRRRLLHAARLITETASDRAQPVDTALAQAHTELDAIEFAPGMAPVDVFSTAEFAAQPDPDVDWVIPGLLDRGERMVVVAPEGRGKSILLRQLALLTADGRHPFTTRPIPPVRTLLVDLENPARNVRKWLRAIGPSDNSFLWSRQGGINLRSRASLTEFERVLRQTKPDLVCLGPLYKSFRTDSNKRSDDVAAEVIHAFDDFRTRHAFALVLEAHAPLKQGGTRELRPFGSQVWMAWPDFGMALIPEGDNLVVGDFRGRRDERTWPVRFRRGTNPPWIAEYETGHFHGEEF